MNAYDPKHYPAPPRLLLGISLMAWGGLNNHALIALLTALLVESRNWLNWRWDFRLKGYSRAWILTLIILAGTVAYHSLNLTGPTALLAFIEWLPLIFLPLILAQQYGEEQTVPTTVFSVIARHRLKKQQRLGKNIPESRIHLGYPYFALILLATAFSSSGIKQQWQFFFIMILLSGFAFYFANLSKQRRILPWLIVLLCISGSSFISSKGLYDLYFWVKKGGFLSSQSTELPIEQNTAIGRLGKIKLDRRIQWRVYLPQGQPPPKRIMSIAYNFYRTGKWATYDPNFQDIERSYTDLLTTTAQKDKGEFAFNTAGFKANDNQNQNFPKIRLRGAINNNRKVIPSPASPILFSNASEIDSLEQNQLGTLLAINADNVIDLEIHTSPHHNLREAPPIQKIRNRHLLETTALSLPTNIQESKTLLSISSALALDKLNDHQKIETLKNFFQDNFQYTTHLKISNQPNKTALENFLKNTRQGHCEYFATATTLLLRASGVPAHYVTGFAIQEKGKNNQEYLLRGSHAHAWCRAYIGGHKTTIQEERTLSTPNNQEKTFTIQREVWTDGQWIDVDLTPSAWLSLDAPKPSLKEKIGDNFQRIREDFQLWRANEKNRGWVNLTLILITITLLIFIIWRLSSSRIHKNKTPSSHTPTFQTNHTNLNLILPKLEKQYGPKPSGQLLTTWLSTNLPHLPPHIKQRLLQLHEHQRFSSHPLKPPQIHELNNLVQTLEQTYAQPKE